MKEETLLFEREDCSSKITNPRKVSLFESDVIISKSKKPKRLKSAFKRAVKSLSMDTELAEKLKLLFCGIVVILIKIAALYLLYLSIKELL